ncbi:MAG TPA: molecular chaperone DnaJ [Mycobacteriales bacterium]|nr:molecular chaperone DnaJ [Mycobacteriales bacterium]
MAVDYYSVLGVRRDAGTEEIKKAYRRLARELHPDVNQDRASQERFKEVTAAYEVLSDPAKREIFDLGGDPLSASGAAAGAAPFAGFAGFGDIMDAFFGAGGGARRPRTRVRQGADALIRLDLDLAETAFGLARELTIDTAVACAMCKGAGTAPGTHPETCPTCRGRGEIATTTRSFLGQVVTARACPDCGGVGTKIRHACPDCAGEGRVRTRRTLTLTVPAGVEDGMRLRLAGEGEVGPGGGPPGDLYVEIRERQHPVFERHGDDLHCKVTLPMTAAALGTQVSLQTLDGEEVLDIRPGTQPGSVLTLRGQGVPHLSRETQRGDLHVHVEVVTPTRLDPEQERLLRELAELRGEDHPQATIGAGGRIFSRLRDAFR